MINKKTGKPLIYTYRYLAKVKTHRGKKLDHLEIAWNKANRWGRKGVDY